MTGLLFYLEKWAEVPFRKGSLVKSKNIAFDINTENKDLEHNKTYKYFGINKANGIIRTINKEKNGKRIV